MTTALSHSCVPATFGIPSLFGGKILSVEASLATQANYSVPSTASYVFPDQEIQNITFCNVTVTYTHPGTNDNVITETWLPVDNWNSRFLTVGGGGWTAGRNPIGAYPPMYGAVANGFAVGTSDAGLGQSTDPSDWVLLSPGNLNWQLLENLGSRSLNDQAIISKELVKSFYNRAPDYSYFVGCSQGGRQGLMLAQRYPTAYDGIVAASPAYYWTELFGSFWWPQWYMNMIQAYPSTCETEAITAAAIKACDDLDGVVDGIISNPDACLATFDPFKVVGTAVSCPNSGNKTITVTKAAAEIVNITWNGYVSDQGKRVWFGLNPGANLSIVAQTSCSGDSCVGVPFSVVPSWMSLFLGRDPNFDYLNLTHAEFDRLVHESTQEYRSTIDADDPDLSAFRNAGGKLITFHGLADITIPPKGTQFYYKQVTALSPDVQDFYRVFELPGLGHCVGGSSGEPTALFEQLREWVEKGTAPTKTPVKITNKEGKTEDRIVCVYPQVAIFNKACGDSGAAKCWYCGKGFATV